MKETTGENDLQLKTDVLAELKYEPSVKVTDIGVLVKNGVVTLNGYVTNYAEKWNAVRVIKVIAGVKAIADDIEVNLINSHKKTDGDIAEAAANQIKGSQAIPAGTVQVTVREGEVTVEGDVEWRYQKKAAEDAVLYLEGVTGVINLISIKSTQMPAEVKTCITSAFERNALVDAKNIQVETSGNKVILRGYVRNLFEREEAEQAAWKASGVFSVDNQLEVYGLLGFAE